MGCFLFWSRIRESKATKHIDTQSIFVFVAEIVAELILRFYNTNSIDKQDRLEFIELSFGLLNQIIAIDASKILENQNTKNR